MIDYNGVPFSDPASGGTQDSAPPVDLTPMAQAPPSRTPKAVPVAPPSAPATAAPAMLPPAQTPPDFSTVYNLASPSTQQPAPQTYRMLRVPSREELGLPSLPNLSYDQSLDAILGRPASPQQYINSWKTPAARAAVSAFQEALVSNFYQAAQGVGGGLTTFFAQNPYSYMLGQSFDMIEDALQAVAGKNGGTDHLAMEHLTTQNLLDASDLINGVRHERLTGSWPSGSADRKAYLTTDFVKKLDAMPARARLTLMNSATAFLDNKEIGNFLTNRTQAEASKLSAETAARAQKLKERAYEEVERETGLQGIRLQRAQTELFMAQSEERRAVLGLAPMAEKAKIQLAIAQAQHLNAERDATGVRLSLDGLAQNEKIAAGRVNAAQVAAEQAWNQYVAAKTKVQAMMNSSTSFRAANAQEKAANPGLTRVDTQEFIDAKNQMTAAQKIYDQLAEQVQSEASDYRQNFSQSAQSKTLGITNWLALASKTQNFDFVSVAKTVSEHPNTYQHYLFFPARPQKWDPNEMAFVPDKAINGNDMLSGQQVSDLYNGVLYDPKIMEALRAGRIMTYQQWVSRPGMLPDQYRHYVSLMNYIRQTDWLLQKYGIAYNHGLTMEQYAKDHNINAPVIPFITAPPPKPKQKDKK